MSRPGSQREWPRKGGANAPEAASDAWEDDGCVRRTIVMPAVLAEQLAVKAGQRGLSVSDLMVEYAQEGLRHDRAAR